MWVCCCISPPGQYWCRPHWLGGLQQQPPLALGAQFGACSAELSAGDFCLQHPNGVALSSCKTLINTEERWLFFTSSLSQDVQPLLISQYYPSLFSLLPFASVYVRNMPDSCNLLEQLVLLIDPYILFHKSFLAIFLGHKIQLFKQHLTTLLF